MDVLVRPSPSFVAQAYAFYHRRNSKRLLYCLDALSLNNLKTVKTTSSACAANARTLSLSDFGGITERRTKCYHSYLDFQGWFFTVGSYARYFMNQGPNLRRKYYPLIKLVFLLHFLATRKISASSFFQSSFSVWISMRRTCTYSKVYTIFLYIWFQCIVRFLFFRRYVLRWFQ